MRERALIDLFAAMEGPSGPALECKYYPCHFKGQDCSLCYCPFYPCLLYRLGGELKVSSKGNYVWSCKECSWVHEKEVVEEIVTYFSLIPRQVLVESDWVFFSRSLQQILFGEELGQMRGNVYDLTLANVYGFECEPVDSGSFLVVELEGFDIVNVRRVNSLANIDRGIVIPEKEGNLIRAFDGEKYIICRL